MSTIAANAMFAAHQAELVATATSLVGRPVTLHVDPACTTAYTDGHRVVTKPIHPLIEAGSPEWHEARALLLHEMMHLQDTVRHPHMHDFRKLIGREWKLTPTLKYIHNLVLDHSIESGQDYTLYKGVLKSITVLHNTLLRSPKTIKLLLSNRQPDWLRALFVLDDSARQTWMPDLSFVDHDAILAVGNTMELYQRIAHLIDDYLQPKGEDPDKDWKLATLLSNLLEAEPEHAPEPDEPGRERKRKGEGEEGEKEREPDSGGGGDDDEEESAGDASTEESSDDKSEESEEGEEDHEEGDDGEEDEEGGGEDGPPCEADEAFLKDNHELSFKNDKEFDEAKPLPHRRREASIRDFVLDPKPRIISATSIMRTMRR